MQPIISWAATLTVFLAMDAVWLGLVARKFYAERLGGLLLDQPRFGVAFGFYAVYAAGIVWFAVAPALAEGGKLQAALLNGAILGFVAYLTYDATNLATMKGFDPVVAAVDVIWGTVLTASAAAAGMLLTQYFYPR